MTKPIRLSHSASNLFQECGKKYYYQYVEQLVPETTNGALIFGKAVDKAIESMIKKEDWKDVFIDSMKYQEINGKKESIAQSLLVTYANSDYDPDLLKPGQIQDIKETLFIKDFERSLWEAQENKDTVGFERLNISEKKLINLATWYCLLNKGLIMLKGFEEKILPKFKKVHSTQEMIELKNSEGDSVVGYIDIISDYENIPKPVIIDIKTSSQEYEQDAVLHSQQLTTYVHEKSEKYGNTRWAGFVILLKKLDKQKTKECTKCGKNGTGQRHRTCDAVIDDKRCDGEWKEKVTFIPQFQELFNEIPKRTEDIVLENYDNINQMVKNGIYHRNFSACKKKYGKMTILCPYFRKCYEDKNDGLTKKST